MVSAAKSRGGRGRPCRDCHAQAQSGQGRNGRGAFTRRRTHAPAPRAPEEKVCGGGEPDEVLVIGEGIETTLAAMQIFGLPGIAALSASNLPTIRPPKCAKVIIAADNDDPGRQAAAQLAKRLKYEGRSVLIAKPPVEGMDWNDRLIEGEEAAREEWRAALARGDANTDTGPISALIEDDFMAFAFPERQLHLSPWLPWPGLVMIHAARGEGKTWFALSVAKAVANGQDLLGWSCPNPARVPVHRWRVTRCLLAGPVEQVSPLAARHVPRSLSRHLPHGRAGNA